MTALYLLLEQTLPYIKQLLREQGSFYPIATVMKLNGEVEQVVLEDIEDVATPNSAVIMGELMKLLHWHKNEYKAVTLFYDVYIQEKETDAIAVFAEEKEGKNACTFYYHYEIFGSEIVFTNSCSIPKRLEFFNDEMA